MLVKKQLLDKSKVKLTVSVTAEDYMKAFAQALVEHSKEVTVPGFRKGMAPTDKVLEQVGRKRIEASALDEATSKGYYDAIHEAKIVPVTPPSVDITKYSIPTEETKDSEVVLTFTAEAEIMPEIDIKGYEKIRVKKDPAEAVTEEELQKVLDYLKRQQAKMEAVEEDTLVENGMFADIAFDGSVDGVKRSDMFTQNHPLVVGEGRLIPGFEDQLIGMKSGEEKTFDITFPKDYHSQEMAGKVAQFKVKINELKRFIDPEEGEDFAKQFGHDNMEMMKKAITEELQKEKDQEARRKLEEKVLEALNKQYKFDVPESMVEEELKRLLDATKDRLVGMGTNWENYLVQTNQEEEEVNKQLREQSEKNVRNGLLLGEILRAEKIESEGGNAQKVMDRLIEITTSK